MRSLKFDATQWGIRPPPELISHHAHHTLTRRGFIGTVAGAAGGVLGASLISSVALGATPGNSAPKPTLNTTNVGGVDFGFDFFGPGVDPSSITDFNGFVGVAGVQGTGTATNPDGSKETLLFDTDMRFMSGVYVGVDGAVHKGAFGFV